MQCELTVHHLACFIPELRMSRAWSQCLLAQRNFALIRRYCCTALTCQLAWLSARYSPCDDFCPLIAPLAGCIRPLPATGGSHFAKHCARPKITEHLSSTGSSSQYRNAPGDLACSSPSPLHLQSTPLITRTRDPARA